MNGKYWFGMFAVLFNIGAAVFGTNELLVTFNWFVGTVCLLILWDMWRRDG